MDPLCCIAGAMPIPPAQRPHLRPGDLLMAADQGYTRLRELGLTPQITVGDFDSLGYCPPGNGVITLPREKDDSDLSYALKLALRQGYRRFLLPGTLGGRLDHSLCNLQLLAWLNTQGALGVMTGGGWAAAALTDGSLTLSGATPGGLISIFSGDGAAENVTLLGLKYPLSGYRMASTCPIGLSNEFTALPARISVERGTLLLLWEAPGDLSPWLPQLFSRHPPIPGHPHTN